MIPKIIHYVWFGGKPLSKLAKKCVKSWEKRCPDFKIIRWDETNFDINFCKYTKEAYENKKWAFLSDVIRLYALTEYGGIYMDTDVEVVRPLNRFLIHEAFSGFEDNSHVPTGIMASVKGFPLFKKMLDSYFARSFILSDGQLDLTTNVVFITNFCCEAGLKLNNKLQNIDGFVLYPKDYFCPKSYSTLRICKTKNTVTIHHFAGSWSGKKNYWQIFKNRILFDISRIKALFSR